MIKKVHSCEKYGIEKEYLHTTTEMVILTSFPMRIYNVINCLITEIARNTVSPA